MQACTPPYYYCNIPTNDNDHDYDQDAYCNTGTTGAVIANIIVVSHGARVERPTKTRARACNRVPGSRATVRLRADRERVPTCEIFF